MFTTGRLALKEIQKWHWNGNPPVRTKDEVSVDKPSSDEQADQLEKATNDGQLINAINET